MNIEIELGRKGIPTGDTELTHCPVIRVWFSNHLGWPRWCYKEEIEQDLNIQLMDIVDRAKWYFCIHML